MLLSGIIIGFFSLSKVNHSYYVYFKHIYYFILPFLYWTIGSIFSSKLNYEFHKVITVVTYSMILYSLIDLLKAIYVINLHGFTTLYNYRNQIGNGSFFSVIGIYFLFFYDQNIKISKITKIYSLVICIVSALIHFSRTMIITLVLLVLFSGLKINFKRILKLLVVLFIATIGLIIICPDIVIAFWNKILRSVQELNYVDNTWNYTNIVLNWRAYEMYCEIIKFMKAGIYEKIFGGGFGTTLDVFGYASLVSKEEQLSLLHNGYFTQLMTNGIIGVTLFILWLGSLYRYSCKCKVRLNRYFLRGLTFICLICTYFIRGPLTGVPMAVLLFLFSLIGSSKYKLNKREVI